MELASARLGDYPLNRFNRLRLEMHLMMCAACRACATQMKAIDRMARRLILDWESNNPHSAGLSTEARRRINEKIKDPQYPPD